MRWLGWLAATPVALLIVVFAVANRHEVRLEFWPLPWALDLPVYLVVLGVLAKGLVLGSVVTWLSGHKTRRRAREQRRRAESLERQLRAAESAASSPSVAVTVVTPDRPAP